jgi:hypothetical protein
MDSGLVRHQRIHLLNPSTNYIRTENCKFCKLDKRVNYRNRYRTTPRSFSILDYNVIEFHNPLEYVDYYTPIEIISSLKLINNNSTLELNMDIDFCSICQDTIETSCIIRKINCGHKFHHLCCDKWLETKQMCPTCRYEL